MDTAKYFREFIIFFLVFWWFMLIIYKLNLPQKLYNKFNIKIVDDLTNCEFCIESHTATLMALILAFYYHDHMIIFYGFMSASLSNILKRP